MKKKFLKQKVTLENIVSILGTLSSKKDLEHLAVMTKEGFDAVDVRFDEVDKRFDGIDTRLDRMENMLIQKYV